jgi:lipoprotein-anchoring transpeptidase ErfK/SrfK
MNRTAHIHGNLSRLVAVLVLAAAQAKAEESATPRRIVVSIPDRKLALLEGEQVLKVYDVAVGKPSTPSPQGEFAIIHRIPQPTWYGPKKIVAPGKDNPLGTRWLGLSAAGYGIHGTNRPDSIGRAASHGCIRMRNADVEELFELVKLGVTVEISVETAELFMSKTESKGETSNAVVEISADRDRGNSALGGGLHPRL